MNSMYFKNILIADIEKHTARFVSFDQGLNVLTSSENHVGKSSVIKSLYDTLGADVKFDSQWCKNTKLSAVTIIVNEEEYRIVRLLKRFAVFKQKELVLLTDSVMKELAPQLSEIFGFSVYLAEKTGIKKVIQAPPAFTFMPYYIDQDKGWSELYDSFEKLDQFSKPERAKSLYFHLGLYTRSRIELQAKKDLFTEEIARLKEREKELHITINALSEEVNNIIPAENKEELEAHLKEPKKEIEALVQAIGTVRNRIQELQTALQQHEKQLEIIKQFQAINFEKKPQERPLHTCPRCGYELDSDLYDIIRNNYNQSNADYLLAQVQLIVNNINSELQKNEKKYVSLMAKLKALEKAYDESQNAYESYLRYRGLKATVRKYQAELGQNLVEQSELLSEIETINKELRRLPEKAEIEQTYISHVRGNLIALGAWSHEYEGKIKLLHAINAQGSLTPKIILSQYTGLFQTMASMSSSVIRFPFVVDSPRGMESSMSSSKEILSMIANISSLPQVIVATVDYDTFGVDDNGKAHKLFFSDQFSVLNEETYLKYSDDIEGLLNLLTNKT